MQVLRPGSVSDHLHDVRKIIFREPQFSHLQNWNTSCLSCGAVIITGEM